MITLRQNKEDEHPLVVELKHYTVIDSVTDVINLMKFLPAFSEPTRLYLLDLVLNALLSFCLSFSDSCNMPPPHLCLTLDPSKLPSPSSPPSVPRLWGVLS